MWTRLWELLSVEDSGHSPSTAPCPSKQMQPGEVGMGEREILEPAASI